MPIFSIFENTCVSDNTTDATVPKLCGWVTAMAVPEARACVVAGIACVVLIVSVLQMTACLAPRRANFTDTDVSSDCQAECAQNSATEDVQSECSVASTEAPACQNTPAETHTYSLRNVLVHMTPERVWYTDAVGDTHVLIDASLTSTHVAPAMLDILAERDAAFDAVLRNRLNAQDTINRHVRDIVATQWRTGAVYGAVATCLARMRHVAYVRIADRGRVLIAGIDTHRTPTPRVFVSDEQFPADADAQHLFLQDIVRVGDWVFSELELRCTDPNNVALPKDREWMLYENGIIKRNACIDFGWYSVAHAQDLKMPQTHQIRSDAEGKLTAETRDVLILLGSDLITHRNCHVLNPASTSDNGVRCILLRRGFREPDATFYLFECV